MLLLCQQRHAIRKTKFVQRRLFCWSRRILAARHGPSCGGNRHRCGLRSNSTLIIRNRCFSSAAKH
ncbi:hypothetical protein [Burkholderia sp. Bp8963]|uniref:hypothetical protein n=1 Tax=Burkholderia sp. Bp8963 TaxID=2184547 RepID=UPI00163B60AF|nr:hypothetical protein [Burkholderia sp. Bp8963]